MSGSTSFSLAAGEGELLAALTEQLTTLVSSPQADDPAIDRLTPDAYPDDAEAGAEFRVYTREDLLDRRVEDAAVVLGDLRAATVDDDTSFTIETGGIDAWLRTLTALRLVLASRLGLDGDAADAGAPDEPVLTEYEWLGYRLETLIRIADG